MSAESDPTPAPPKRRWATGCAIALLLATATFFVVALGVYVLLRSDDQLAAVHLRTPSENATFTLVAPSGGSGSMPAGAIELTPETGREIAALLDEATAPPAESDGEMIVGLTWPPVRFVPPRNGYSIGVYPVDALFVVDDPVTGKSTTLSVVLVAPRYAQVTDDEQRYRVLDSKKQRLFELLEPLIEKANAAPRKFVVQP